MSKVNDFFMLVRDEFEKKFGRAVGSQLALDQIKSNEFAVQHPKGNFTLKRKGKNFVIPTFNFEGYDRWFQQNIMPKLEFVNLAQEETTFGEYIAESKEETVVYSFGRFNPPTAGHEKLMKKIESVASRNRGDFFVFGSNSHDKKKNPLPPRRKLYWMRKLFPKFASNIIIDRSIPTFLAAAAWLYGKDKYDHLVMVVGSDRVADVQRVLEQYNGVDQKDFYRFKSVKVVSAGERDPDAEGVAGVSASMARKAALENDFDTFQKALPSGTRPDIIKELMKEIKKEMT